MSKIAAYAKVADEQGRYFRTGKGAHRHASQFCANSKRSIDTGDVTVIPADEVANWEPCIDCCTEADVDVAAQAAAVKADTMCPNNKGVAIPRRIYSTCNVCGKEGKVNRATGSIRAHKRQA